MYSFRAHPLTWLFLIATASIDAAAIARDFEQPWLAGLTMGQLYVASAWLALGRSHRLARAGVFVATILLLGSPDFFLGNRASEWAFVMGTLISAGISTAVMCWIVASLRSRLERAATVSRGRWQVSIIEILGWMIIVAAASAVIPEVHFSHVTESALMRNLILLDGAFIALLATAFLPPVRDPSLPIVMYAGLVLVASITYRMQNVPQPMLVVNGLALAYFGLWILAQRLDELTSRGRQIGLTVEDN
jgi:hypothetical protein